jgi:hypothetical protein
MGVNIERQKTMKDRTVGNRFTRLVNPVIAAALCVSLVGAGCATSTRITTLPDGAKITLDNRYLGDSPVVMESRSGFMETHHVTLQKDGYATQSVPIHKSYRADESLVLLLFGIIPYFFSARYEDSAHFILQKP